MCVCVCVCVCMYAQMHTHQYLVLPPRAMCRHQPSGCANAGQHRVCAASACEKAQNGELAGRPVGVGTHATGKQSPNVQSESPVRASCRGAWRAPLALSSMYIPYIMHGSMRERDNARMV